LYLFILDILYYNYLYILSINITHHKTYIKQKNIYREKSVFFIKLLTYAIKKTEKLKLKIKKKFIEYLKLIMYIIIQVNKIYLYISFIESI